jgi:uncharacterized membrane protein
MSQTSRLTGVALAAAAATLFIAGCASESSAPAKTADSSAVKVKCYGANSCKGQAECKTVMNSCKGQNSCKGHGFLSLTEQACIDRLGRA